MPSISLVVFIVASALVSVSLFFLALWWQITLYRIPVGKSDDPNSHLVFFLTNVTMFFSGMTGGCLSNLRRILKHTERGRFDLNYRLSYYLRPLYGGIAGLVVFFLLLGGALTLNVGRAPTPELPKHWMTPDIRATYILFGLLAGYGSREFGNKLADLVDSLFALSKDKRGD
ncbi:MAG: hypothetical protein RLY70_3978 [Planctomycetota bacterium]